MQQFQLNGEFVEFNPLLAQGIFAYRSESACLSADRRIELTILAK